MNTFTEENFVTHISKKENNVRKEYIVTEKIIMYELLHKFKQNQKKKMIKTRKTTENI